MFSRRHPYLFFILIFSTVVATAMILMTLLVTLSTRDTDFEFGEKVGVIEINGIIADSKNVHRKDLPVKTKKKSQAF